MQTCSWCSSRLADRSCTVCRLGATALGFWTAPHSLVKLERLEKPAGEIFLAPAPPATASERLAELAR